MASALFYTAQLDPFALKELQALESELGVTLVAMQPDSSQEPAQLDDTQLGPGLLTGGKITTPDTSRWVTVHRRRYTQ